MRGLDTDGVMGCDTIATIPVSLLGPQIGAFLLHQEGALTAAIHADFDPG